MADKVHVTKCGIQALKRDSEARQYVEQKIRTGLHVLRCACHIDADVSSRISSVRWNRWNKPSAGEIP